MAMIIDWHAHHTAPEIADQIKELTGKRPHVDAYDSPDLSKRVKEMDDAGLDVQLVCQGAGVYADQLPAEHALNIVTQSNNVLAERIAPHRDRLFGVTALSLKNIDASVKEIDRTSSQGFRAVLLYPHVDGEMLVDLPVMDPIFAKISKLNLPIFLGLQAFLWVTWHCHLDSNLREKRKFFIGLGYSSRQGAKHVLSEIEGNAK
jgi:predicted TIM-barrel fold metal-dependent hydrolase